MSLHSTLSNLSSRLTELRTVIHTEEATKHSLIMPLIGALGYNTYDPFEVVPEYTADVGGRKAEKVDYAIQKDGKPIILIEAKAQDKKLDIKHAQQLFRYFTATSARFAILTNGVEYKFFTDIVEANKMDEKPFFEFSLEKLDAQVFEELKKFSRDQFDLENILGNATELKYMGQLQTVLTGEYENPSDEFVKMLTKRVYDGPITQNVKEQFSRLVKRSFNEFISARINRRLQSAIEGESVVFPGDGESEKVDVIKIPSADGIVTTEDELEGHRVVRAILAELVSPERVVMRDTKSYCGILLDDNNRKQICRFCFDLKQKRVEITNNAKEVLKFDVETSMDLYKLGVSLKARVQEIEQSKKSIDL